MLTLTGKQTGTFNDSLIEIPDGKWFAQFDVNREDGQSITIEPLPAEFLTNTSAETRDKLRQHLFKHRYASLGHTPVTVTRHIGVPSKKRQRKVYDNDLEASYEPNLKELFVADAPFLLFYVGIWSQDAFPGSSTFLTARMVNSEKKKRFPQVPHPMLTRGAHGWNWTKMSDLASVVKLDPLVLWNFYFHTAIGSHWVSTIDDEYGFVYAFGDTPEHTHKTREVDFKESAPAPIPNAGYEYGHLNYELYLKQTRDFARVQWDKIWVEATWAMRVCYLHYFSFKPA